MKTLRFALAPLTAPAAFAVATAVAFAITPARPRVAVASSHAEAPAISDDPAMDNTDVWAWQDGAATMTIVTAWNGVSTPSGGPNYKKWVPFPQAIYEIHIDTDGDGVEDLTYQFQFTNVDNGSPTFLRAASITNTYGRLASAGDANQKFLQTYKVKKITGPRRTAPVATSAVFNVAPPNTGPQLTWGRVGGVNASSLGTAGVTAGGTAVTTSVDLLTPGSLANGQVIQFGNQAGTTYTVSALTTAGFTIAPAFSGPTNATTTIYTTKTQTNSAGVTANNTTPAPTAGEDYETQIAASAINPNVFGTGEKIFVGPRADAFFIDLGPTFDRLKIRTYLSPPGITGTATRGPDVGQYGGGFNTLAGKNVEVIAIQIPIDAAHFGAGLGFPFLGNSHVGVWASSSRSKVRVLPINTASGQIHTTQSPTQSDTRDVSTGSFVQVSRLGNPLVNELFIPFDRKDAWNGDIPKNDDAHWGQYFSNPEVAGIINAVYGVPIPPAPRNDLQFLFAPDTLKVRTNSALANSGSPAFVGGPSGALDGRTLSDDVTDIYLQAAAGILIIPTQVNGGPPGNGGLGLAGIFGMPAFIPASATTLFGSPITAGLAIGQPINGLLGDGCEFGANGAGCGITITNAFPYMQTPWDGQEFNNDYFQTPRHN